MRPYSEQRDNTASLPSQAEPESGTLAEGPKLFSALQSDQQSIPLRDCICKHGLRKDADNSTNR